jgi:NDP-sugar pyrophosphorylase family protein
MKKLLICPGKRTAMGILADRIPLVQIPIFGQTLVEYWLSHLACTGFKHAALLATDRPESLQALVQDAGRWGMELEVIPESRELTLAEVLLKYDQLIGSEQNNVTVLDHLPGVPESTLFKDHATFFNAIRAWMPHCLMPDRVGIRQLAPGIWAGLHARVSASAQLKAPCWLGRSVSVGNGAMIGPGAVIEDGSMIEPETEIVESYIGPDTLVGQGGVIRDSIAWGNALINWKSGSVAEIRDAFILCGLRRPRVSSGPSWIERVSEMCASGKEEALFIKDLLINKEGSS